MSTAPVAERTRKPLGWKRIVGYTISIAIVVAIFWWAIPKFADYRDVWAAIKTLTPFETWSLVAATAFNLLTYWWANQAALPGLGIGKAAVLTQTTTSVANTLPAGGAIAVGLTYSILDSWGFTGTSVALYVGVTGIWNIFTKLALPMLALVFLALSGHLTTTYILAAIFGLVVLSAAVGLFALVFRSEAFAIRIGN
jgi:putative heme transporter